MPNWCSNHITVRGSNQAEIQRLAKALSEGEFCHAVIPTPKDLTDTVSGFVGEDQRAAHEAQMDRNVALYGYKDWYAFQTAIWGTKWDVSCDSVEIDDDGLGFSGVFESAWSPPMGIAAALVEQGYEVTLYYYEPGMGFVGKFEDGSDDYYEYNGENSKTVRAAIGDELDDMFGISESMAEYEAENEEELTEWLKDGVEQNKKLGLIAE
jgi:Ferredoxin-like domain in Api92-like protein